MKTVFILANAIIIHFYLTAQTVMTIGTDSTIKVYTEHELRIHEDRCRDGKKLVINDSTKQILTEIDMRNCRMNGIYKRFYDDGKLKELGSYKNGKREGFFFYWNIEGVLLRKELWENNRQIKPKK